MKIDFNEIPIIVECSNCSQEMVSFEIKEKYICDSCVILNMNYTKYKDHNKYKWE